MKIYLEKEKIEIPDNSNGLELAKKLKTKENPLAMNVNGQDRDLSYPLKDGDNVSFYYFDSKEGKEIFWHTSAHVLAQAVQRLWPDAQATIGPPIEEGFYYDFANLKISDSDFAKIEKEIKKILGENLVPKRVEFVSAKEALQQFGNNPYKKELIESFENGSISAYEQGDFIDLCRGPHLSNLGKIQAFKVTKTSGAYWRGDQKREMLTRIYGISFPEKKMLADYLLRLEEAKKRDHKLWGKRLDLFSFHEEAPGMPLIHPNGMAIWENLVFFIRECLASRGYQEIKTPVLMNKELWIRSGHWAHYRENMYTSEIEEKEAAIKPMNCPGCMMYYRTHVHSYRELPLRVAEIGHVHRHEPSGALHGLFRVRGFHQDDAHLFMRPDQIKDEILDVLSLADKIYMTFGLPYKLELSTRPEKSKTIGTDKEWEVATKGLQDALDDWGHSYKINEGDGAFYGPKIDIHIRDALGRFWQCGTIQLDMSLPEKFELEFVDSDGEYKRPVMIHRALFGSIERFFGILIEHFAGRFPLWLSPLGVRMIPVADRHIDYAKKIANQIKAHFITCDIDTSQESVGKKIRNAQLMQANYMLTVGDNEVENNTISLRTRNGDIHGQLPIKEFLGIVEKEKASRALVSPYAKTSLKELSTHENHSRK